MKMQEKEMKSMMQEKNMKSMMDGHMPKNGKKNKKAKKNK